MKREEAVISWSPFLHLQPWTTYIALAVWLGHWERLFWCLLDQALVYLSRVFQFQSYSSLWSNMEWSFHLALIQPQLCVFSCVPIASFLDGSFCHIGHKDMAFLLNECIDALWNFASKSTTSRKSYIYTYLGHYVQYICGESNCD